MIQMQMQMNTKKLEVSLSNELLAGEEVIWSGRPLTHSKSFSPTARGLFITGLIYTIVGLISCFLGLLFLLNILPLAGDPGRFVIFLVLGGLFVILGVVFLLVVRLANFAPRSSLYAITNRRAMIIHSGRYLRVTSYNVREISQVQRLERPDGSGDLIFAGTAFASPGIYIAKTPAGRQGIFSALADVRQVEQKLLNVSGKD
ncbi:MAG TPA: hypothetical protein VGD98_14325 [Ktedonobacteraceae bacterium]